MKMMSESFIIQTAYDYDLDVEIVRRIINNYPDTFYDELEYFVTHHN